MRALSLLVLFKNSFSNWIYGRLIIVIMVLYDDTLKYTCIEATVYTVPSQSIYTHSLTQLLAYRWAVCSVYSLSQTDVNRIKQLSSRFSLIYATRRASRVESRRRWPPHYWLAIIIGREGEPKEKKGIHSWGARRVLSYPLLRWAQRF